MKAYNELDRRINSSGYVEIKIDNIWQLEHRVVVEKFIGRLLEVAEVVHHIDKNKQNNSINNLMIFPNANEHLKFHIYFDKYGFNKRTRKIIATRWKPYKQPQKSDTKDL